MIASVLQPINPFLFPQYIMFCLRVVKNDVNFKAVNIIEAIFKPHDIKITLCF